VRRAAIADRTPLTVVSRSRTTAKIDTFMSAVSTTRTSIVIDSRTASRGLAGRVGGGVVRHRGSSGHVGSSDATPRGVCRIHPVRVTSPRAARGTVVVVALLSGMMRASMFTGDPRYIHDWFNGRQQGRWMYQNARTDSTVPPRPPDGPRTARPADPAVAARGLAELEARGVLSADEAAHLRGRLGV
jgi:hypothetical protein